MKNQQLLPSIMYKNYNSAKSAQREEKSRRVKNTDVNPIIAEYRQNELLKNRIDLK